MDVSGDLDAGELAACKRRGSPNHDSACSFASHGPLPAPTSVTRSQNDTSVLAKVDTAEFSAQGRPTRDINQAETSTQSSPDTMPKKRVWKPLDLCQIGVSVSPTLSGPAKRPQRRVRHPKSNRPSDFLPHLNKVKHLEDVSNECSESEVTTEHDDEEDCLQSSSDADSNVRHFKRPSAEHATLLLQHSHRRRQKSGMQEVSADAIPMDPTAAQPDTLPTAEFTPAHLNLEQLHFDGSPQLSTSRSPMPFDQTNYGISANDAQGEYLQYDPISEMSYLAAAQNYHQYFENDFDPSSELPQMGPNCISFVPPSNCVLDLKPPSHYPAVKGTSGDTMYNQRRAELQNQANITWPPLQGQQSNINNEVAQRKSFTDNTQYNRPSFDDTLGMQYDDLSEPPPGSYIDPYAPRDREKELRELDRWFNTDNRFSKETMKSVTDAWEIAKKEVSKSKNAAAKSQEKGFPLPIGTPRGSSLAAESSFSSNKGTSAEHKNGSSISSDLSSEDNKKPQKYTGNDVLSVILPVIATLESYRNGPRDYWTQRWVQPPDWCIDRSPEGVQSAFGNDWGTPPARVGRDPRYRPMQSEIRASSDSPVKGSPTMPRSMREKSHPRHWRSEGSPGNHRWASPGEHARRRHR